GTTYPQEFILDYNSFINLFLSHNTFIALKDDETWDDKVL
ncbi:8507_t:CDS:1, partial [Scutellospora calospora]